MTSPCELLAHLSRVHTTEMGAVRIRRNLNLAEGDVVAWCKARMADTNAQIIRRGKNWYVTSEGCVLTVNAASYTIITAHRAS